MSRELDTYIQHFDSWSQQDQCGRAPSSRSRSRAHSEEEEKRPEGKDGDNEEAEVERINLRITREGGATGGWHPQEHDMFLQIWSQVRGSAPKDAADDMSIATLQDRCALLLKDRR